MLEYRNAIRDRTCEVFPGLFPAITLPKKILIKKDVGNGLKRII